MPSRNRTDHVADLLVSCIDGSMITRLLYLTNMPHARLLALAEYCVDRGLLEPVRTQSAGTAKLRRRQMEEDNLLVRRYRHTAYKTTKKGMRFLGLYDQLQGMAGFSPPEKKTLDEKTMNAAQELLEKVKKEDVSSGRQLLVGKKTTGLKAACYYIVSRKAGMSISFNDIAMLFNISPQIARSQVELIMLYVRHHSSVGNGTNSQSQE